MNPPSPHPPRAFGVTRRSSGLSPAHIELIKMLAAKAVDDFFAETEATDEDHCEEAAR